MIMRTATPAEIVHFNPGITLTLLCELAGCFETITDALPDFIAETPETAEAINRSRVLLEWLGNAGLVVEDGPIPAAGRHSNEADSLVEVLGGLTTARTYTGRPIVLTTTTDTGIIFVDASTDAALTLTWLEALTCRAATIGELLSSE
ncbi:MAG: hypothetical protein AAGL98_01170, partial [Planctomycetota bacterium]